MLVTYIAANESVEMALDPKNGYSNDYPNNRFSTDSTPNDGDCGAFGTEAFRRALLKIGIDIGTAYYEPTGGYYPWDGYGFLEKYFDRLPYDEYRNEVGDLLVSYGHTVIVTSVKEENGKGYDEITHARNDDDGKLGDYTTGREITTQPIYDGGWNWIFRLKPQYNKDVDIEEDGGFDVSRLADVRKGSTGGHVKSVQCLLNEKNGAELLVDGYCGELTENAIKHYQSKFGCGNVDGWVGEITWNDLLTRNV